MTFQSKEWERIFKNFEHVAPAELAKSMQRLARERAFLETIFNTLQEGVLVIDGQGIITYANAGGRRLLGIGQVEVGTLPLRKISPDLARSLIESPRDLEGESWSTREIEVSYPERRILRVYSSLFHNPEEFREEPYVALILTDITQEKAHTDALLEEEKLASVYMLAAGVAHEIGNPLNSLTIHLGFMERQLGKLQTEASRDNVLESVHVCQEEVKRLDGIVRHFLKALKPVAPDFQDVNLLEILADVLAVQKAEMEDLGVQVSLELGEPLPVISADPALIKQVFFNLLKNALEAMDHDGCLTLTARLDDCDVFIDIQDNGVGIEPESLAQLFTPYYTTKATGHGLGLVLAMRILRAHGGQLGVKSTPGKGTCMTLQLPQKHRRVKLLE